MSPPSATPALQSDYDRAIATLVTAFVSDPFIRWMFPDAKQYLHYFPLALKHFAGRAFDHETAYRSEDYKAVALWLPPGVGPDEEGVTTVMQEGVDPELQGDALALLEQAGASHPPVPHWYLPAIGVEPMFQGQGYASALLAQGVEGSDGAHVAAYLEATNPANIPLYRRFGFKVVGEIQAGSSPRIFPMLRAAR
ncbi:GNAT family N-acetyltransferase [Candidatus Nitrospira allomarina]|uniref:GNAT family N-acetyltransferase n=1 Tax=Candidatus Nitrospira allomarina TaxID=3020900 RepID=A0AA96JWW0_9BACT|nr:GNAT family N-acetyltransferase [Candidatus Nitrospira allomarina]WNM58366.1 GNAT family N-acetyltransferase [Candidatus Nitrospira allomarina]